MDEGKTGVSPGRLLGIRPLLSGFAKGLLIGAVLYMILQAFLGWP